MLEILALHFCLMIGSNHPELMNPSYVFLSFCYRIHFYWPYFLETATKLDEIMAMVVGCTFNRTVVWYITIVYLSCRWSIDGFGLISEFHLKDEVTMRERQHISKCGYIVVSIFIRTYTIIFKWARQFNDVVIKMI